MLKDQVLFDTVELVLNIAEDGSYGVPIYSFVNDTADLTVVPTAPEVD